MLHIIYNGECIICLHSPERMTVNHDVAGSSPAGGAKRPILSVFFFIIKEK